MGRWRLAWLTGLILIAAISLASLRIPFLWDTTYHSQVAGGFYEDGFDGFIPPPDIDNGNPVLYPTLLALSWQIGGRNLFVSHLMMALILMFLLAGLLRLAGRYADTPLMWLVPLLVWADPAILSQSLLIGYDILLLALVIWGLVSILDGRPLLTTIMLILMLMTHSRGIMAAGFLLLFVSVVGWPWRWRQYLPFAIAILALSGWHLWHWSQTGWFLTPEGIRNPAADIDIQRWLRNASYSVWRSLDIGRIGLWGIAFALLLINRRHIERDDKVLVLLALMPILLHILAFSHTGLPVSQRYFLLSQVLVVLLLFRMLRFVSSPKKILVLSLAFLSLMSGNLWHYPDRFGNAWDSTLKFVHWPAVERSIDGALKAEGIDRDVVAAHYPLTYPVSASYLNEDESAFLSLGGADISSFDYVIYSNFSNMYTPQEKEMLVRGWIRIWESRDGCIVAAIYKNPSIE